MSCRDYQNLMVMRIYAKLTPEEHSRLEAHVRNCGACARKLDKMKEYQSLLLNTAEAPAPDWEKSWRAIEREALDGRKRRYRRPPFHLRWIYAAAAVIVVFVVGFFAGRQWMTSSQRKGAFDAASASPGFMSIGDYTESLEMILVSFLNRSDVPQPESLSRLEQAILRDIVNQTRILKGLAAERGDEYQKNLMEDLELILMGMANLKTDDRRAAEHLTRMIRDKEVRFKLQSLKNWEKTF